MGFWAERGAWLLFLLPFFQSATAHAMIGQWIQWKGQSVEVVPGEMLIALPENEGLRLASSVVSAEFLRKIGNEDIYRIVLFEGSESPREAQDLRNLEEELRAWDLANPRADVQPNFIYRLEKKHRQESDAPPSSESFFWPWRAGQLWSALSVSRYSGGDDPSFEGSDFRWDMAQMQIPEAHRWMTEKKLWNPETVIAVLDTGFFPKHPALRKMKDPYSIYAVIFYNGAKVYTSHNEYESPLKGMRRNPETGQYEEYTVVGGWHDWVGHGTHCAGTVAGFEMPERQFRGVAPGYTIMPIKVLDDEGSGSSAQILQGVYYAKDRGAKILSMSLGGPGSDGVSQRVYADAEKAGLIVIAAAGNSFEQGNPTFYPAAFPSTLAVASLGSDGWMSYFSQAGDWVDVAAPGGDGHKKNRAGKHRQVFSTYTADPRAHPHAGRNPPEPGEDGKYYVGMSGTSMATPHVSGLIALMMSVRPQLNLQEAKAILQASGRTLPGSFYPKQQSISPRVRVVDALAALKKTLGQESDPQPGEPGEPGPPPVGGGDWTSLSWIAEPSLKKEEVRVEKIRIHFGFRDDWEWRPPPGSRLDLSDPTIANTLIKFNKKIIPGDRDSTAYMDLSLRVNGRIEDSHTVFFRRLTKEKPFVLFSWRRDPALGRNAELLLNLDQSQKKYSIRVRIFED